ncbi:MULTISPECIES: hypothetical protein [unclassified Pantoea]|uniref:hypothetical protein n=1 Tax=unclassified Pantoea TaxID=2630326 RepID=UPI001232AAF5|nr:MULTISPECIES: hypothetical protein [unclassified Pantoea]KAA5952033.1 hypothetical protein F3I55_18250 [Pantoea sp. VH_24]KAA5953437.1 hypothetical protein F3I53_22400 [Pantoea sp. VH_16]KAA5961621.1 hypothetical protein F3I54_19090 [Pantoea sp. VH_18]KAA5993329.1 hypothetical protein F3I46_18725 [Pantoea sp. M_1]KAA5998093.1 hypothetical protein F3I45_19370 [Pantoea sp. F_7]
MKFMIETLNHTSRWVLKSYEDEPLISGNEFSNFSYAIKDLQAFALDTEKSPIICKGQVLSGAAINSSVRYPVEFELSKMATGWLWHLYHDNEEIYSSSSLINPNRRYATANSALRSAMRFRAEMAFAPAYESGGILVNATHFSKSFALARAIADPHPSAKSLFR